MCFGPATRSRLPPGLLRAQPVRDEDPEAHRVHEGHAPKVHHDRLRLVALGELEAQLERIDGAQVEFADELEVRDAVAVVALYPEERLGRGV